MEELAFAYWRLAKWVEATDVEQKKQPQRHEINEEVS